MVYQRESRFGNYLQRAMIGVVLGGVLLVTACAPEPDASGADKSAESGMTGQLPGEGLHDDEMLEDFDPLQKQTELPASFPSDLIVLPEAAVIDDAGEYEMSSWFVVLRTESLPGAEELLNVFAAANAFDNTSSEKSEDGSIAGVLTGTQFSVEYVSLPDAENSALLSLVITQV